jgi:predicted lactoylglutathione lyase
MAMTGSCKAWPPYDHGSRPDQRSWIWMDQHRNSLPWERLKNLSQYIQDAPEMGIVFSFLRHKRNLQFMSIRTLPVRRTVGVQTTLKGEHVAKKIFVNLPVRDLKKSMDFFGKLGFTFNGQFTDETAACMVISEDIYVMLLTEPKFKTFTPRQICDATKSTEVLVCLSSASRDEVNEMVRKAVAAGGTTYKQPEDHGFMYGHGFQDLDGHIWELAFMEPSAIKTA